MDTKAFDLGENIVKHNVTFMLYNKLWDTYKNKTININFQHWSQIKYLNKRASNFSLTINKVPNDKGGIYIFFVKCHIISGLTEYPLYIGRAQLTKGQNLRKRVKEYFQKYSNNNERPKITKMLKYWGKELHLAYYPLGDNKKIVNLEKELINSLLLPLNDEIPDSNISKAIKAFK